MFRNLNRELNALGYNTRSFFEPLQKKASDLAINLPDDPVAWTEKVRIIKGKPFSFADRPYLLPIYRDPNKDIYIVKARQMEFTEFSLNWILFLLTKNPGTVGLYVTDTQKHSSVFSKMRLHSWGISQSPILKQLAKKNYNVSWQPFTNESHLYMFSGWDNYESARSIPADFIVLDEAQSTDMEAIPVLKEALSKSEHARFLALGTGSMEGDWWQKLWETGTQSEWDANLLQWIPKNPTADASSYHITQYLAKWISPEKIEKKRFSPYYTQRRFTNEVLGWWHASLQKPLTEKDMMNLFDNNIDFTPSDQVDHTLPVYAGFDWGGGTQAHTVAWIWQLVNANVPRFRLLYLEKIDDPSTEVQADRAANLIDRYQVDQVVMDAGGGTRQVEKLAKRYSERVFKCNYRYDAADPIEIIRREHRVNVDRTWGIETIIDLIKRPEPHKDYPNGIPRIHLPYRDPTKIEWIIDNFTCIEAETASANGKSFVKYTHEESRPDDALHACVYAYLAWVVDKGMRWDWVRLG